MTLTANEPVQSIEGWTLDETQTVLTKAHDKNGTYHVTVRSAGSGGRRRIHGKRY